MESDTKMEIKQLAIQILVLHLVSVAFVSWVMFKQLQLLIKNATPDLQIDRKILLFITTVILLSNVVPILVDVLTLTGDVTRSTTKVNPIGAIYAFSNAIGLVAASVGWFVYYKYLEHQLKRRK